MTFSYVDLNTLSALELKYLQSINKWVDDDILTQVYVVLDNDDIKSVFCLKQRNGRYVGAELCFGTKESERNKGYCKFGLKNILEVIKKEPQLEEVLLISVYVSESSFVSSNKVTDKLCKEANIPAVFENIYCISNPNFNPKYKELETMIRKEESLEKLQNFCDNDEFMLEILDLWLKKYQKKSLKGTDSEEVYGTITESYSK